jgi:hypothetical protein
MRASCHHFINIKPVLRLILSIAIDTESTLILIRVKAIAKTSDVYPTLQHKIIVGGSVPARTLHRYH